MSSAGNQSGSMAMRRMVSGITARTAKLAALLTTQAARIMYRFGTLPPEKNGRFDYEDINERDKNTYTKNYTLWKDIYNLTQLIKI